MTQPQPRDRIEQDVKLPNNTDYFDRDSGIKRYESVHQKTCDLQETETVLGKSGRTGDPLHPHGDDEGLDKGDGG